MSNLNTSVMPAAGLLSAKCEGQLAPVPEGEQVSHRLLGGIGREAHAQIVYVDTDDAEELPVLGVPDEERRVDRASAS